MFFLCDFSKISVKLKNYNAPRASWIFGQEMDVRKDYKEQKYEVTQCKKSHDNDIVVFSNSCLKAYFFGRTSGSDEVKLFYENCALNFRLLSPFFVCSHVMTIATTKPWWLAKPSNLNHQKICFQSTFFLLAPKIHLFSQLIAICKCQGKISLELEKLNGLDADFGVWLPI